MDVKHALDNNENMLSYSCAEDGRLEFFAATYADGDHGQIIENVDGDYESITIDDAPADYLDRMDAVYDMIEQMADGRYGHLFDAGNRLSDHVSGFYVPDADGLKEAAQEMYEQLPEEEPDRVVTVEGEAPDHALTDYSVSVDLDTDGRLPVTVEAPEQDYSEMSRSQVYHETPDNFKTGCHAGSCGTAYAVIDGELTPLLEEDAFIPDALRVFED